MTLLTVKAIPLVMLPPTDLRQEIGPQNVKGSASGLVPFLEHQVYLAWRTGCSNSFVSRIFVSCLSGVEVWALSVSAVARPQVCLLSFVTYHIYVKLHLYGTY